MALAFSAWFNRAWLSDQKMRYQHLVWIVSMSHSFASLFTIMNYRCAERFFIYTVYIFIDGGMYVHTHMNLYINTHCEKYIWCVHVSHWWLFKLFACCVPPSEEMQAWWRQRLHEDFKERQMIQACNTSAKVVNGMQKLVLYKCNSTI